jgi:hypothetical protein
MSSIDADGGWGHRVENLRQDVCASVSEWLERSAGILLDLVPFYFLPQQRRRIGSSIVRRLNTILHQKYLFLLTLGAAELDSNALSGPLGSAPRRPNSCLGGPRWGALATRGAPVPRRRPRTAVALAENKLDARTHLASHPALHQHGIWRIRRCAHSTPALPCPGLFVLLPSVYVHLLA